MESANTKREGCMNMDVCEAIAERHSYRGGFLPDVVPREDLVRIMEAGLAAPTGCNKQTVYLVAIDDAEVLALEAALQQRSAEREHVLAEVPHRVLDDLLPALFHHADPVAVDLHAVNNLSEREQLAHHMDLMPDAGKLLFVLFCQRHTFLLRLPLRPSVRRWSRRDFQYRA